MALIYPLVLPALYIQPTLYFVLPVKQSLEAKYLPPGEANLDAKILVKLLLHLYWCLPSLQLQYLLFVVLSLVSNHL